MAQEESAIAERKDASVLMTCEALMLAAWTKATVDFGAPMVWDGKISRDEVPLLVSAGFALVACVEWGACLTSRPHGAKMRRFFGVSQAFLWMMSGAALASAERFPPVDFSGYELDAVLSKAGAWAWTAAGLVWLGVEVGLYKFTRPIEVIIVVLWSISSLALVVAAGVVPAPASDKWTYVSSSAWAGVGCFCWGLTITHGGSLVSNTQGDSSFFSSFFAAASSSSSSVGNRCLPTARPDGDQEMPSRCSFPHLADDSNTSPATPAAR